MRSNLFLVGAVVGALVVPGASASMTNFREWVDSNGLNTNSTGNLWYGTTGVGGPLMVAGGGSWVTPAVQFQTPLIGPITAPGSDNGAAGPATFDGLWVHPGSGVPAVLVFAPQSDTLVGIVNVHSELIANGLNGNGVTINVITNIGGVETDRGTTTLGGTSSDQLDLFSLGQPQTLQAGDTISIVFGDRGSYLFDHVNFNVWMTVPTPGVGAAALIPALIGLRRRRAR